MAKQGTINVTSENIFPVIKKFMYSDHEIFLRELVSNAVDATQKLKTVARAGDFKGEYDGGDLHLQEDELADARWFARGECPITPPPGSIAYRLINNV